MITLNDCLTDHLTLGDTLLPPGNYSAIITLNSGNLLSTNSSTIFSAGQSIELLPGFEAPLSTEFDAIIEPCSNNQEEEQSEEKSLVLPEDPNYLTVMVIPDSDIQMLEFLVPEPGIVNIEIFDQSGNQLFSLVDNKFENKAYYQKRFRTKKIAPGIYQVVYSFQDIKEVEKLLVI